jgi:phage terminase small subunit
MAITCKQETFCQGIASGLSQSEAYRRAYNAERMSDKSVWETSAQLVNNLKVASRITALKAEIANKHLWTREKSVKALAAIAENPVEKTSDKVSAIKELNSMHGFNAAQKVDLSSSDGSMTPKEPAVDLSKLDIETLKKLRDAIPTTDKN